MVGVGCGIEEWLVGFGRVGYGMVVIGYDSVRVW